MRALILLAAVGALARAQPKEPAKQEIAEGYRSKSGGGGIPGHEWERWRIREIRGWKLHFKQIARKRSAGVRTLTYRVVAQRNHSCAQYELTDAMPPVPPPNPQMPSTPIIVVDAKGVSPCR